jgi:hypothetical protein
MFNPSTATDHPVRFPILKGAFLLLIVLNVIALNYGVTPFFTDFAQLPVAGKCSPEAIGQAYYGGIEVMRNVLWSSLKWLVGIALLNLIFAGAVVLRKKPKA